MLALIIKEFTFPSVHDAQSEKSLSKELSQSSLIFVNTFIVFIDVISFEKLIDAFEKRVLLIQ